MGARSGGDCESGISGLDRTPGLRWSRAMRRAAARTRGGTASQGDALLRLRGAGRVELDAVAVLLDGRRADALHRGELVDALERTVGRR